MRGEANEMPIEKNLLVQQIFSIPLADDTFLIYAPLKGLAFIANAALVNMIAARCEQREGFPHSPHDSDLDFLHQLDFFTPEPHPKDDYAETGIAYDTVVLFLTNQCNLRCSYCYASSGEFTPRVMSWEVTKAAIDRVLGDVVARKSGELTLGFHGGGEPTMNWKLLTRATDYARGKAAENGLALHVAGAFNGYWSDKVRRYMIANFTDLSLSFDGLPGVQNRQRPATGQKESFGRVAKTLATLDQAGFSYGIRMTVTKESVGRLAESVAYICEHFRPKKIQAEPVFLEGRASRDQAVDDAGAFVEQFIAGHAIATRHGVDFFYSGARPDALVQRFCLAACRALVVTADGDITACFETYGRDHPLSARFMVGGYQGNGQYLVERDKLGTHFGRTVDSIPYCQGCFCKWHCAGDCAVKASAAGRVDEFQPTGRCAINQELTTFLLLDRIRNSGGLIWQKNANPGAVSEKGGANA